ncbi:hypothetical protein [Kitasatospora sp. NPDC015120]|uniref:hypothetical protein n=1 Tax=Kitasatospora sp. NPDC015120 TaxID=3364023 RepID=UPI0036F454E0
MLVSGAGRPADHDRERTTAVKKSAVPIYYLAARPDGTVLTGNTGPTPVDLLTPDADGIVHHPARATDGTWYPGTRFTLTTQPGEAVAGLWSWPARPPGPGTPGGPARSRPPVVRRLGGRPCQRRRGVRELAAVHPPRATSGRRAVALVGAAARRAHREAADTTLDRIVIDRATDAARAADADRSAAMEDRLTDYVLTALRGGALDRTPTAAA